MQSESTNRKAECHGRLGLIEVKGAQPGNAGVHALVGGQQRLDTRVGGIEARGT